MKIEFLHEKFVFFWSGFFSLLYMDVLDATRTFLALCDTPGAKVQGYPAEIHEIWSYHGFIVQGFISGAATVLRSAKTPGFAALRSTLQQSQAPIWCL